MEDMNLLPMGEETLRKNTEYEEENAGCEIFIDSVGDYVLADYQPEIRKILFVESELIPSGRYESGGEMEAGGTVKHRLVYLDGEDTPSSVELTSDYDYTASAGKEVKCAFASERIASVSCRLSGPRKLSIKTKVGVTPHLISVSLIPTPSRERDTELLFRTTDAMQCFFSECEESATGEIRLDGYTKEELRLLSSSASVAVREAKRVSGGVTLSGELLYKLLFAVEDSTPLSVKGVSPIDCFLPSEMPEGTQLTATGYVTSLECNMEDGGDGVAVASVNANMLLSSTGRRNTPIPVVADAFIPESASECTEGQSSISVLHFAGIRSMPISERVPAFASEWEEGASALDTVAVPLSYTTEIKNGMLTLVGEYRVRTVTVKTTDEGKLSLSPIEAILPFSMPLHSVATDEVKTELSVKLLSPEVKAENGDILFRCELLVAAAVTEEKSLSSVTECTPVGEKEERAVSLLRICYPSSEDTLWSIAKNYRIPVASVVKANRLPEEACLNPDKKESLKSVSRLLIVD